MKPIILAAVALTTSFGLAGNAHADRIHTDSFGNLVVYSSAGYKRIVVGAGATEPISRANSQHGEAPRIAWNGGQRLRLTPARDCEFGAVLLHGRSYMYGLPDHVVPTPAARLCP